VLGWIVAGIRVFAGNDDFAVVLFFELSTLLTAPIFDVARWPLHFSFSPVAAGGFGIRVSRPVDPSVRI
jgi:hypothetical protein